MNGCQKFLTDQLTVIVSRVPIDATEWRRFVLGHWDRLMWRNSRLVVLTGVHGSEEGGILPDDTGHGGFVADCEGQFRLIRRSKGDDMADRNISLELVDLGAYLSREQELAEERLAQTIIRTEPTVLVLAFCYTDRSRLNAALRTAGIYSVIFLEKNRYPNPCHVENPDCDERVGLGIA